MRSKKLLIIFSIIAVVALLVVLNSAIFSVRHVAAIGNKYDDFELEEQILSHAEVKKSQNIFFLPENKIIERIESELVNVKVINIERIFPDRVHIHYAKILEYVAIAHQGQYIIVDNNAKIMRIDDQADFSSLIKLKMRGAAVDPTINSTLATSEPFESEVLVQILDALDRLNYRELDQINFISQIDISVTERIFLHTRTGVVFEIIGTARFTEKLQAAVTTYLLSDRYKYSGTIRAWQQAGSNKILTSFDEE